MNFKKHFEFWNKTIFDKEWVANKYKFITQHDVTRIFFWTIIILLNVITYYCNPNSHSLNTIFKIPKYNRKHGWYFKNIKYHTFYKYLITFILLLDIVFLYYLSTNNQLVNTLHTSIFYILIIIIFWIVNKIYNNKPKIKKKGQFNPLPPYLLNKNYRVIMQVFLCFIYIYSFFIEYKIGDVTELKDGSTVSDLFWSRFGGYSNSMNLFKKSRFIAGWTRLIGVFLQLYLLFNTIFYFVCKYNLPESWEI